MFNPCGLAALNHSSKVIIKIGQLDTIEMAMRIYKHNVVIKRPALMTGLRVLHGMGNTIRFHRASKMSFNFAAGLAFVLWRKLHAYTCRTVTL